MRSGVATGHTGVLVKKSWEIDAVVDPIKGTTRASTAMGLRRRHTTHGAAATMLRFHAPFSAAGGGHRAAERFLQRVNGRSIRNQLAMAMAKMIASRSSSVGQ